MGKYVGIDLGTTFSVVSYIDEKGNPVIIPNKQGENTTPSVERSVLLRMGVSSLDCMPIVNHAIDHGLMGKGCGHCVYKLSKLENISIREASIRLAKGEGWDKLVEAFKGGKK